MPTAKPGSLPGSITGLMLTRFCVRNILPLRVVVNNRVWKVSVAGAAARPYLSSQLQTTKNARASHEILSIGGYSTMETRSFAPSPRPAECSPSRCRLPPQRAATAPLHQYGRRLAGLVRATPDSWSDVHAWVLAHRWRYFFAILTLFKNYFQ